MAASGFKSTLRIGLVAAAIAACGGCDLPITPTKPAGPGSRTFAPIQLETAGIAPRVDYADLAVVLADAIRDKGEVEPVAVRRTAKELWRQLRLLAVTGPTATPALFPDDNARLAYWLNARTAWALGLTAKEDYPRALPPAGLEDRPVPLDGRSMTLRQVDAELHKLGGWQAWVAAPCVRKQRAHLPTTPLAAKDVRRRIRQQLNRLVDDPDRFEIDYEGKIVRIPPALWSVSRAIVSAHCGELCVPRVTFLTCLLKYVEGSAHRRLQDAMGLPCEQARESFDLMLPRFRVDPPGER